MRVCAVQPDTAWEDKKANMSRCQRLAMQAAGKCDLLVFPELTLTSFSMNPKLAEPPDGETAAFFRRLSLDAGAAVAFGFAVRTEDGIYNRLCVADGGEVIVSYDKIHPFSYGGECEVFSAGDKPVEAEIRGVCVGLTICYDLRFPELYQKLSRECRCIINIANWPEGRRAHWTALLTARAIENQSFIIGCNRCGSGGGLRYSGDSAIISPEGEVLAAAEPYREQLVFAEVDAQLADNYRKTFPVKNDRRNELYKQYYL